MPRIPKNYQTTVVAMIGAGPDFRPVRVTQYPERYSVPPLAIPVVGKSNGLFVATTSCGIAAAETIGAAETCPTRDN
jgi:hypothetical protein